MVLRSFFIVLVVLFASGASAQCVGRLVTSGIYGEPVCVPEKLQHVVILDYFYNLGMALELDMPVVGAPLMAAPDIGLRERALAVSVEDIGDARQPNLEKIISLKPDLIIGEAQFHGQFRDKMSKIAPTVLIDATSWKDHFTILAQIAGQSEKANIMLKTYEDRISMIRSRVRADVEVSVIRIALHGFHVYLDGPSSYAPYAVLREAGVKRTAYETVSDDTVLKRPDWEEIGALDGHILLYVVVAGNAPGQDDALEASTVGNPFWQMLPAVQAKRAFRVDKSAWFGFNSIASAHRILDDIEHFILTAP